MLDFAGGPPQERLTSHCHGFAHHAPIDNAVVRPTGVIVVYHRVLKRMRGIGATQRMSTEMLI